MVCFRMKFHTEQGVCHEVGSTCRLMCSGTKDCGLLCVCLNVKGAAYGHHPLIYGYHHNRCHQSMRAIYSVTGVLTICLYVS